MSMKDFIIAALIVAFIVVFCSVKNMANEASYWMKRCDAAESVIDKMWEDKSNYMLDVMSETDVYSNWKEYND